MSNSWLRLDANMLNNPGIQMLSPDEFRAEFIRAAQGEPSCFEGFLSGPFYRPPAQEWRQLRVEVFERDNFTCQYCGVHGVALECDHVIPVAKGGKSNTSNLITACRDCNRSKGSLLLEYWSARR